LLADLLISNFHLKIKNLQLETKTSTRMSVADLGAAATHASVGALKAALLYAAPTVLLLRRRPAVRTTAYMALFVGVARLVSRWLAAHNRRKKESASAGSDAWSLVRLCPNAIAGAVAAAFALALMEPGAAVREIM
jgi:hypothetical protein